MGQRPRREGRLLLPPLRRARIRRRLTITQATRCPSRAIWCQLTAELDQSPQLVQEAGAVVSQVFGDEFPWKLGLRHMRRSGRMTPVQDSSPYLLWKLWKNSGCRTAGARSVFKRAVGRLYDARPGVRSPERGTDAEKTSERAPTSQRQRAASVSPFVWRRCACEALSYVGWSGMRH